MTVAVEKRRIIRRKVVRFSIGLGMVACLAAFIAYRLSLTPSIGTGPAGPDVPRAPWAKTWTDRPVLLLGIGDSVTAGFGASPSLSYFDRLVSNPKNEFGGMEGICLRAVFPNLEVQNLSVSGSISIDHSERQIPKIKKARAEVLGLVVMTTGGNDIIHDYGRSAPCEGAMYGASLKVAGPWIANYEKRLEKMIGEIRGRFPGGCHIFLANIYDPTDGVGDIETAGLPPWEDGLAVLRAYNQVIEQVAGRQQEVHLVDIHSAFLGHGIHSAKVWSNHYRSEDPHYWYFSNLEDPNDRGYDAIRRVFLLEIAKALANTH